MTEQSRDDASASREAEHGNARKRKASEKVKIHGKRQRGIRNGAEQRPSDDAAQDARSSRTKANSAAKRTRALPSWAQPVLVAVAGTFVVIIAYFVMRHLRNAEVVGVLEADAKAIEEKSVDAFVDTVDVDPECPEGQALEQSKIALRELFTYYDVRVSVERVEVLERTESTAKVRATLVTRKVKGPAHQETEVTRRVTREVDGAETQETEVTTRKVKEPLFQDSEVTAVYELTHKSGKWRRCRTTEENSTYFTATSSASSSPTPYDSARAWWPQGAVVDVSVPLYPVDATDLACAAKDVVSGMHCSFETRAIEHRQGSDARADPNILQPFLTDDRRELFAAGLWQQPAVQARLSDRVLNARGLGFTAQCKYTIEGKMDEAAIRRSESSWLPDPARWWLVGHVSECKVQ